jgi:hypothetical protein
MRHSGEKMKIKHVSNVIALAMIACFGTAHAEFTIEDGNAAKAARSGESHQQGTAGLSQTGTPNGSQPFVHGMAREVSLLTAMKQVVPQGQGWKAKRAGGLDVNKLVSWRGAGRAWPDVLQELAVANNFSAIIDWNAREVTIAPALYVPTGSGFRPTTTVSAVASGPISKTWELLPTLTLRENIEVWAKSVGWNVSWASVDYPVTSKISLTGVFEDEAAGPFNQLAKAYEKAEQPLTFTFYTNKVLRVENSTYKQVNVHDQMPNNRAMQ